MQPVAEFQVLAYLFCFRHKLSNCGWVGAEAGPVLFPFGAPSIVFRQSPLKRHPLSVRIIYLIRLVRPRKEEPARRPVLANSMLTDLGPHASDASGQIN